MTNPETNLIQKLSEVRRALEAEREALLARVAAINEALAVGLSALPAKSVKSAPKQVKAPRGGGVREAILASLAGKPAMTIRQLQGALPDHPAKTIESVTHVMAKDGLLTKDGSTPKRFAMAAVATTAE